MTIKFDHRKKSIAGALGVTKNRERVLDKALKEVLEDPEITSRSRELEAIIERASIEDPSELAYVALHTGSHTARRMLMSGFFA